MRISTLPPTDLVHKTYGPGSTTETQNTCSIFKEIDHDLTVSWNVTMVYPSHLVLERTFKWACQLSPQHSLNPIPMSIQIIQKKKKITQPLLMNSIFCCYNVMLLPKLL